MSNKVDKSDPFQIRGGRLARRARSFKEDLLEKITNMRSPSSNRALSPNKASPRTKHKQDNNTLAPPSSSSLSHSPSSVPAHSDFSVNSSLPVITSTAIPGFDGDISTRTSSSISPCVSTSSLRCNGSSDDLSPRQPHHDDEIEHHYQEVRRTLFYLKGLVQKNIFELLPGTATVLLESVLAIHSALRKSLTNEHSSLIVSSTNQVYHSLANLIRWADDVLVDEKLHNYENVEDLIQTFENAITVLVELVVKKLKAKNYPTPNLPNGGLAPKPGVGIQSKLKTLDVPLTPREKEILQQTTFTGTPSPLHHSLSSDSILNHSEPPPKPPLPQDWESLRFSSNRRLSVGSVSDVVPPVPPKQRLPRTLVVHDSGLEVTGSSPLLSDSVSPRVSGDWALSPLSQSSASESPLGLSASSLDSMPNKSSDDLLNVNGHGPVVVKRETRQSSSYTSFEIKSFSSSSITASSSGNMFPSGSIDTTDDANFNWMHQKLRELSSKDPLSSPSGFFNQNNSVFDQLSSSTQVKYNSNYSYRASSTSTSSSSMNTLDNPTTVFCPPLLSSNNDDMPPAIPPKKRNNRNRTPSQYDNVPEDGTGEFSFGDNCPLDVDTIASCDVFHNNNGGVPPPLPPKRKQIMQYMMQIIGNPSSNPCNFQSYSYHEESSSTKTRGNCTTVMFQSDSEVFVSASSNNEAVRNAPSSNTSSIDDTWLSQQTQYIIPPALPPKLKKRDDSFGSSGIGSSLSVGYQDSIGSKSWDSQEGNESVSSSSLSRDSVLALPSTNTILALESPNDQEIGDSLLLQKLDISEYLILKKSGEDGPDIRGGPIDALVVHAATETTKNNNDSNRYYEYHEAFLTTYRTFLTPSELINKLLFRYKIFSVKKEIPYQRAARSSFSLLVSVVDSLCGKEMDDQIAQTLVEFVYQLVTSGELMQAKALRKKMLEKWEGKKRSTSSSYSLLETKGISTRQATLLDFKSEQLAEQMTLLDAELFLKIEIPEVLIWSRLQKEEHSPNLTHFTEHFNKMSYWSRSRILEQEEAKDRERYVTKFIKIMKHLRKMNNFNSYLAILSALDSAPIRRLEWQKHITEGLKEYCQLIDSSKSFIAYRQALAETAPPCIPYIGLILQDLTFVHIGNSDVLPDGHVNFSKRWQQFTILDHMKRFKKLQYSFKRNERILAFFNYFDNHLCEEAMWQISESIKPRGGKKKTENTNN